MESRIKLAEARGWVSQPNEPNGEPVWLSPDGEDPYYLYELPDPFTDANDDYAVLAYFRHEITDPVLYQAFQFSMPDDPIDYEIGDYARAALKVIDDE